MVANLEATIEDLYAVRGKAEIVNGEIVHMSPTGAAPGYAASEVLVSLRNYSRESRQEKGYAVGDSAAFRVELPNRKSFSPDVAYHVGKWTGMKFLEGAPVFAVEVRSKGDYGPAAEATMVLIDDVIKSYRADEPAEPRTFRRDQIADAEPAVPGWSMPVSDLFVNQE